jgi:hypothetical protein
MWRKENFRSLGCLKAYPHKAWKIYAHRMEPAQTCVWEVIFVKIQAKNRCVVNFTINYDYVGELIHTFVLLGDGQGNKNKNISLFLYLLNRNYVLLT